MVRNLKRFAWMLLAALGLVGCGTGGSNCASGQVKVDIFSGHSQEFEIREQGGDSWKFLLAGTADDNARTWVCLDGFKRHRVTISGKPFDFTSPPSRNWRSTGPGGGSFSIIRPIAARIYIDELNPPGTRAIVPAPVPVPSSGVVRDPAPPIVEPDPAPVPIPGPVYVIYQCQAGSMCCQPGATCITGGASIGNIGGSGGIGKVEVDVSG